MTNEELTYAIACGAGAIAIVAWFLLILVPAWSAYSRLWQRIVATVLAVYVLVGFALAGAGVGVAFLWYFDRL